MDCPYLLGIILANSLYGRRWWEEVDGIEFFFPSSFDRHGPPVISSLPAVPSPSCRNERVKPEIPSASRGDTDGRAYVRWRTNRNGGRGGQGVGDAVSGGWRRSARMTGIKLPRRTVASHGRYIVAIETERGLHADREMLGRETGVSREANDCDSSNYRLAPKVLDLARLPNGK